MFHKIYSTNIIHTHDPLMLNMTELMNFGFAIDVAGDFDPKSKSIKVDVVDFEGVKVETAKDATGLKVARWLLGSTDRTIKALRAQLTSDVAIIEAATAEDHMMVKGDVTRSS